MVHNQDNREHDLLDSDDYYQFEGGLSAAIEHLKGVAPKVYHNDHSRPERPVIRTLDEEISRVMRSQRVSWDYAPPFDASTQYLRNHLPVAEMEDRTRFPKIDG